MPESSPLVTKLPAGRHAICRCGQSSNAPLCDGTHVGTEYTPEIIDLDAEAPYAWCRCRTSGNLPACDGSHMNLQKPAE